MLGNMLLGYENVRMLLPNIHSVVTGDLIAKCTIRTEIDSECRTFPGLEDEHMKTRKLRCASVCNV